MTLLEDVGFYEGGYFNVFIQIFLNLCKQIIMTSEVVYQANLRTLCTHKKSNFQIETDAPIDNNGKGMRFSPTDMVATALSACMITVMGIKAEQSGIPFSMIHSSVQKIMAANPRRIDAIVVELYIGESWTPEQRKIMEQTAKTCPVARSLSQELRQEIKFIYK